MRGVIYTSQFKRDYKKRSLDRDLDNLLTTVIDRLLVGNPLSAKFRDHALKGGYAGCR